MREFGSTRLSIETIEILLGFPHYTSCSISSKKVGVVLNILIGSPVGKIRLGRWEGNIRMHLQEICISTRC